MQLTRRQLFAATAALGLPSITAPAQTVTELPAPEGLLFLEHMRLNMLFGPKKTRIEMIKYLYLTAGIAIRPEMYWSEYLVPVYEQHRDYVLQERKKRGQNIGEEWVQEEILDDYMDIFSELIDYPKGDHYAAKVMIAYMGDLPELPIDHLL
jgi:hypothetical protein